MKIFLPLCNGRGCCACLSACLYCVSMRFGQSLLSLGMGLPLVIGLHVCMWLVIEIKWNLIDLYIFIYESIWLWGVLLFLIYSVWTKFVLIDKKGKYSYSTLKENDNGNFPISWVETVLWVRGQLHIMTGSQEVFGKHLLGQKCFSIWGWGVWLSFFFFVFIVNSIETPLKLSLFFIQNPDANNLLRRWWNCAGSWKKEKVRAWTELNSILIMIFLNKPVWLGTL